MRWVGQSSVLSSGIHSFPFKLGLPLGLPSTFLGKHGWVQYYCKTALRETNGLIHKNKQVFIVMNPINLNLEPSVIAVSMCLIAMGMRIDIHRRSCSQQDFRCEMEHRLGMRCVGAGTVVCKVSLDRGGYVPGESIGICATVHNNSRIAIRGTRALLTETIQYVARGRLIHSEKRELASLSHGKIRPGDTDEWLNEHLYVPPLPPTNLRGCHLIKISYDVYVSISTPHHYQSLTNEPFFSFCFSLLLSPRA